MSRKKNELGIRLAAKELSQLPAAIKNEVLKTLAVTIEKNESQILKANSDDLARLPNDISSAFRDRLTLNSARVKNMVECLRSIAKLADPVNELVEERKLKNGLNLRKVRAPLGVIFLIFEARPNVILEAFALAFKSGNAIILRGGSESRSSNHIIYQIMRKSLMTSELKNLPYWPIEDYDHSIVRELLIRNDLIDVVVPRGGGTLIEFVQQTARMPVIKNDRGMCHTYIDEDADLKMGVAIVRNAKTQRPGVCNALETVLVHKAVAEHFLPLLYDATADSGLLWRVDSATLKILTHHAGAKLAKYRLAKKIDWSTEHLDIIINCKIVSEMSEALAHIEKYGSRHSEAIVTKSNVKAQKFQREVDAAAVYWNASTRFTDGFEFGLGGELGISTQKLHVRGPVGLRELTTPRWLIDGTGQIRD